MCTFTYIHHFQDFCHTCFWCVCCLPIYLLCLHICLYFIIIFIWLDSFLHFIFNGRIIALQYCAGLHQTSTWIAMGLPMSPPTWTSLLPSSPSHPSRMLPSPSLSSLSHIANSHWLSILHMVIHVSMSLHAFHPLLPPPPAVSVSLLMSVSPLLLGK